MRYSLAILFSILFLTSCKHGNNFTGDSAQIYGESIYLTPSRTIDYSTDAACQNPMWSVSNPSVVRMVQTSDHATVTALAKGESFLQVDCDDPVSGHILLYVN